MTPKSIAQMFHWLVGKSEIADARIDDFVPAQAIAAATPTPPLPPSPPAPVIVAIAVSPSIELAQFRTLLSKKVDYSAARRRAGATIDELFAREEAKWLAALAAIRATALQSCSSQVTGEELNVVASNFASNALFVTDKHRFFDCSGDFGRAVTGALTSVVLQAELALGRQAYQHVSWPQPYWNCNNLPPLDNHPLPLKLVASARLLSLVRTTYTAEHLAHSIHRIEQDLFERLDRHRQALRGFAEKAVMDRKLLLAQWCDQLARNHERRSDVGPRAAPSPSDHTGLRTIPA
jgi:hypothetical protein